jgi:hypothetical protein
MSSSHSHQDFVWSLATLTSEALLLRAARASSTNLTESSSPSNGSAHDQTPTAHCTPPIQMAFTELVSKTQEMQVQVLVSQTRTVMVTLPHSVLMSTSLHA